MTSTERKTKESTFNFLSSLQQMSLKGVAEKFKFFSLIADKCYAALDLNQIKVPRCKRGMEDLSKGYESNYVAYEAQANGNCFFNSVYICLYGNPDSAKKLRVLTLKYIVRNYELLPDDVPNEGKFQTFKECKNPYGWSNPLTIYCAAHALSITIWREFE